MPGSRLAGEHLKHERDIWRLQQDGLKTNYEWKWKMRWTTDVLYFALLHECKFLPSEFSSVTEAGTNSGSELFDFQLCLFESSSWCQMFVFQRRGAVERQAPTRKLSVSMFFGENNLSLFSALEKLFKYQLCLYVCTCFYRYHPLPISAKYL